MRSPAFRDDPHPMLRTLRETGRIERDVVGVWLACHHAEVSAGLRNSHLSREPWRSPAYAQVRPFVADSALERLVEQWMLFNDPPKHTRLRRLVNGAFKPPVVAALRERIAAITDELLDAWQPGEPFELMSGLAQPLPVRVICDILGLPAEDYAQTKRWSDAMSVIVEPVVKRDQRHAAARAAEEMVAYLRGHIAARQGARPRDDVLGLMMAAHDDGGEGGAAASTLSADELLGNLILLFIAGHETTTNLIGNGTLTLLSHPGELARLRADPSLTASAVEEMLRYEGSVTMVSRMTVEPYPLRDVVVPSQQVVMFMLSPANRDPAVFADAERFDIGRTHNPHLAFGAGIHFCLGAPLARLEAEVAFERLIARHPQLQRAEDGPPRWRPWINLRGLERLALRD